VGDLPGHRPHFLPVAGRDLLQPVGYDRIYVYWDERMLTLCNCLGNRAGYDVMIKLVDRATLHGMAVGDQFTYPWDRAPGRMNR
jgi:hypothetical protein